MQLPVIPTPFSQDVAWKAYTPQLLGETDNPSPTFSTQTGRYTKIGNLVYFDFTLVSTTMTKTTLPDAVRVSLPMTVSNNYAQPTLCEATLENGTPVLNGNKGQIINNTGYMQFLNFPLDAASATITYALASLGVLTNTITIRGSGFYEV